MSWDVILKRRKNRKRIGIIFDSQPSCTFFFYTYYLDTHLYNLYNLLKPSHELIGQITDREPSQSVDVYPFYVTTGGFYLEKL